MAPLGPLFSRVDLNKLWHGVQNEETLICCKFGKDLFNISKVIGRKKVAQFFLTHSVVALWQSILSKLVYDADRGAVLAMTPPELSLVIFIGTFYFVHLPQHYLENISCILVWQWSVFSVAYSNDGSVLSMTLTNTDDQLVVGSSNGDLLIISCLTGDVVSSVRRAHGSGITAVVVNSTTTVLASGMSPPCMVAA